MNEEEEIKIEEEKRGRGEEGQREGWQERETGGRGVAGRGSREQEKM